MPFPLRVIPLVAYHFRAGPWRKMWIRYGYDPRQERDARVYVSNIKREVCLVWVLIFFLMLCQSYQVLDFRCAPEQTRSQGEKPGVITYLLWLLTNPHTRGIWLTVAHNLSFFLSFFFFFFFFPSLRSKGETRTVTLETPSAVRCFEPHRSGKF